MIRHLLLAATLCTSVGAPAQDATQTDGDKYKVVLENAQVRVLEYRDLAGARTQLHKHPHFVVIAMAPFKRRIHLQDGRILTREFKVGDVMYSAGESHIGENVGSSPTHVLLIEMKGEVAARPARD
jgi:quercetin dioxygenase-like cupin family protein